MTEKRFWQDPYLTRLDSRITRLDGNRLELDATIFYAESGGQESDRGTMAGRPVLQAEKQGNTIVYTLADASGLAVGDTIVTEIDGPRRLALIRLHFAAELVLELTTRRLPGIEKIGAHIGEDKARVDFLYPESLAPQLPAIADAVAQLVGQDLPVVSRFSDPVAQRRTWEIAGFARVPCGGTHPRTSGEVGRLRLKRKNVGKGKERIEITLVPD